MGVWPGMTEEQLDYIEKVVHKFCWQYDSTWRNLKD